jgi:hypothetical protein
VRVVSGLAWRGRGVGDPRFTMRDDNGEEGALEKKLRRVVRQEEAY